MKDAEVNLGLIESLKREVDRLIRSDVRGALARADEVYGLARQSADPLARALGLRAKAQALHVNGQYAEAVGYYEQAGEIYRAQGRPVEAARVARALVDALMYLGRYDEALALAAEARGVFAAHGETLLAAQLETNVGNIHHRLDRYHEALACYTRAADVFAAAGDAAALAVVTFNRANIHSCLDDFRRAGELYHQAHELHSSQGAELSAAQVRYNLGYLDFLRGDYHRAVRALDAVRGDFVRLGDERHVALCELDLAEIYLQLNVLDEAARRGAAARARFEAQAMRYEAAKALTWLGLACLHQSKLDEAAASFTEARREFAAEGNAVFTGLLDLYLAELALKRRRPDEALRLADEAERLFARRQLKAKRHYAQLVLAKAALGGGRRQRARELCELVLAGGRPDEAPWLRYQAHELLGDLALGDGAAAEAYEHYAQAVNCVERIRGGIRVDEFRSAFFRDKLHVYEKLIRLCLAEGGEGKQAEAFFYLESCKARTLVDLLVNELEVTPASGVPAELLDEWRRLREELHWYYSRVNQSEAGEGSRRLNNAHPGHSPNDHSGGERLGAEVAARERALSDVARRAQLHDPHFVRLRDVAGLTVAELRAALGADETVVEYYFDADELKIFVIDRERLRVVDSPCRRAQLKTLVLELKFQLEKFQYGPAYAAAHAGRLIESANACLRELHAALFAPIAPLVAGRRLVLVPFDLLHNVPFQALYDGESYLLDGHEISYAPSARLLALCRHGAARHGPAGGRAARALILGVADEAAPRINEEVNAIRALFPEAGCFTGARATADALARHLPGCDVVHIASHAVFRQDNPMFSAFRLADGWLNFYDVCALDFQSALVTLSGCSTGANRIYAGDEINGLARGFLSAGAGALVVSLWAVSDTATAKLMAVFYERLRAGLAPQAALRAAALATRNSHPHPWYWSPFVLIGRAGADTSHSSDSDS
jgi:CHAT domain-containing protein/tetratricopeptide (TPR) repeat protein